MNLALLRRCAAALKGQREPATGQFVVLMHPSTHEAIRRADARAQWYAQYRANRIAKRSGQAAAEVARQFTGATRVAYGVRIVISSGCL